jgi:hypothetical protein
VEKAGARACIYDRHLKEGIVPENSNSEVSLDNGGPVQKILPGVEEATPPTPTLDSEIPYAIGIRIDSRSALPHHLQCKAFDTDVWERVVKHPIKNPALRRAELDQDTASRELVRQIMAAANEREKEVLLHNQERVFREIFGRALDAFWNFMNTPLLSPRLMLANPPQARADSNNSAESIAAERPPVAEISNWKWLFAKLLTPKYILLILSAFLAATTGYSQLQVKNLEQAIKTYQTAAEASTDLREGLSKAVDAAKDDRAKLNDKILSLDEELASVRNAEHQLEVANAGLQKERDMSKDAIMQLTAQLASFKEKQSDDVKAITKKAEDLQLTLADRDTKLAKDDAEIKSLTETKIGFQKASDEREKLMGQQADQLDALRSTNSELINKNAALEANKTLLSFAETCISNVRREAGSFFGMDKGKINQFLTEYDAAKKTLLP